MNNNATERIDRLEQKQVNLITAVMQLTQTTTDLANVVMAKETEHRTLLEELDRRQEITKQAVLALADEVQGLRVPPV